MQEVGLDIPVAPVFRPLLVKNTIENLARYKGAWGGRSSAKSTFFADLAIVYSVAERCDIICIRETQLSLRDSVKKLLEERIEALGLGSYFRVLDAEIQSCWGGKIIFQGMQNHTAESIKSLQGFRVAWVEEAQALSQRSWDLLTPTIRMDCSEIWCSWNPNREDDPVDAFFRQGTPPKNAIVVKANFRDNPWLPKASVDDMALCRSRDPDKYAHVWLGEYWKRSSSRVFTNWKVEEFERPEGTIHRLGADWGFSIDPSCLVRCSIEGNRLYIDHEAYMVGCEIVNLPDLFRTVPEAEKWWITADSARPETINYMQTHGFPKMTAAVKGKKSVEEGVAFLQSFDIVVHPRCANVIDELSTYSYRVDPMTDKVLPILEDKRNHLIDSLRYAGEGIRRARSSGKVRTTTEVMNESFGINTVSGSWMG